MLEVRCNAMIGSLPMDATFTVTHPWTVLFGQSGSGKSALLRMISGLWTPAGSSVRLDGIDVGRLGPHKRRVAFVPQQPAIFPHMTVEQNIAFTCRAGAECRDAVDAALEMFDLLALRTTRPQILSGGERQRVAIARALCTAPRLLLLDEVFTGMHRAQRETLTAKVQEWCGTQGISALNVTHDLLEALHADEVLRIDTGRIIAQGAPHVVLSDEREAMMMALSSQPWL